MDRRQLSEHSRKRSCAPTQLLVGYLVALRLVGSRGSLSLGDSTELRTGYLSSVSSSSRRQNPDPTLDPTYDPGREDRRDRSCLLTHVISTVCGVRLRRGRRKPVRSLIPVPSPSGRGGSAAAVAGRKNSRASSPPRRGSRRRSPGRVAVPVRDRFSPLGSVRVIPAVARVLSVRALRFCAARAPIASAAFGRRLSRCPAAPTPGAVSSGSSSRCWNRAPRPWRAVALYARAFGRAVASP